MEKQIKKACFCYPNTQKQATQTLSSDFAPLAALSAQVRWV